MRKIKRIFYFLVVLIGAGLLFVDYGPDSHKQKISVKPDVPTATQVVNQKISSPPAPSQPAQEKIEIENEKLSAQFSVVANAYAGEIQYPPYAQPLMPTDTQLLQPNAYSALVVPLERGGSASIELDAFRFIFPEPVKVRLRISGMQVYGVAWRLIAELTGENLASGAMQASAEGYEAVLTPEKNWDGPVRIEIDFKHGSQLQTVQTGFEYSQPVATIVGVGQSFTEAADLVIPVKVNTIKSGTYRIRANLFDANRKPLAVLSATDRLGSGDVQFNLRAYKTLVAGAKGPLWLGTFQLEQRSPAPGEPTRYGKSEEDGYSVDYSGSEQFSDESYQPDAEEQQRLEFLKHMAERP